MEGLHLMLFGVGGWEQKKISRMKKVAWEFALVLYFQNQIPVVDLYITFHYSGKIQESLQNYIVASATISESIEDKH